MKEPETPELWADNLGRLGELFDEFHESHSDLNKIIRVNTNSPENLNPISMATAAHIISLRSIVSEVLTDETSGDTPEDKANLIATFFIFDDRSRVNFLRKLSGEPKTEVFNYNYRERSVLAGTVSVSIDDFLSRRKTVDESALAIIHGHTQNIHEQVETYFQTDYFKSKLVRSKTIQENRNRLKHIAATAAGTAIGGIIAVGLWYKSKKYF